MYLVICPGIHDPAVTDGFLTGLMGQVPPDLRQKIIPIRVPTSQVPPFSAPHVLHFLRQYLEAEHSDRWLSQPIVLLGFSAGVVGAIGTAWAWQQMGGTLQALIAVDGWGVPLSGSFPIHRLSHDHFTHWSGALLGAGEASFYAEPAVEHLELWRSPNQAEGWCISPAHPQPGRTTAAAFLSQLLQRYAA